MSCIKVGTITSEDTGVCAVAIVGGPFTDSTIDGAVEAVAFDLLGEWGAVLTAELCIGNDTTVDGTETSGSTSSRAEAAEELATIVVARWSSGSVVGLIGIVDGPLSHNAVRGAGTGVACNRLGKSRASLATGNWIVGDVAVLVTNTAAAGFGAETIPVVEVKKVRTHVAAREEVLVVCVITVIRDPVGNNAVAWARLGVASDVAGNHWAGSTAILGGGNNLAELNAASSAARLGAETLPDIRRSIETLRVEELVIVGLVAVVRSPFTNDAISWTRLDVAWNSLGQSWAVLATIGWLGDDVTINCPMATPAGRRALTIESLWSEEVYRVLREDSGVCAVSIEI